jgi:MoaA/NifB/PqqE/SkfB family radical SAM enzyme
MKTGTFLGDVARNRFRKVNLPRYLTYIVTWTCNARCIMCDCWKKDSPEDLTVAEAERIFRQLPRMDAVRLSGGEPFVRKDFAELAEATVRLLRPRFLHVTTNGFLTDRAVGFCERRDRSTPLRVLVSLDGLEAKHNTVRGRAAAWKTASATVKALAPRQEEWNLQIGVNQTIVDAEGFDEYRKLREWLRPLNVRLNAVLAYDASSTYTEGRAEAVAESQIGRFTTLGSFGEGQISALADEIEGDLAAFPWADRMAKRYYWRGVRERLQADGGKPLNPPCVALNSHMRLYPNGDVPVCQFNSRKAGNLRRQTFEEVWFGERIAAERDWVRKCPGCWAECEVLPNAVYTGDIARAALPAAA